MSLLPGKLSRRLLLPATVAILMTVSCSNAANRTNSGTPADLARISLPPGFSIDYYARNIDNARSMTLGDNGTLFVGSRGAGNVYALVDTDHDYHTDSVYTIASGLNYPNGVAFRDGALYVAEISSILRFDSIEMKLAGPPDPVVVFDSLPTDRSHGWKFIAFGPDGRLYVPVGAPCNVCERPADPRYASITRMNPDGSGFEVYAHGIRNTVGFAWQPGTDYLYFTDNGRDNLGDNQPPDELNRATGPGMHFGFPYCHGGDILDPTYGAGHDCADYTPPVQKLGPHVASLGMRFYTGSMFPAEYRNRIFIAEHGSWNRSVPIGYRVTMVTLDSSGNGISYEPFAEGWLQGTERWGRPVDVQMLPDGSLLVSDDYNNAIYRIRYEP